MNENRQEPVITKEEMIKMLDINEEIRKLLNVPNKNNLYKDLGLNFTYLNLKNFIAGREPELKKKSIKYLSEKLNVLPLLLFIDLETLDDEDILFLKKIQLKFLDKLAKYVKKFENDQKRITAKPVSDEDIKKVEEILQNATSSIDIDLSELDIEV